MTSSPGPERSPENTGADSGLKRGPWTASEDAILSEYVQRNGEGNWNAIHKHTELARCGKSCRLRWTNHLKPDLKKGAFSQEEEQIVVQMQARLGNKWARMAAELPGRTDNEIKNFWNTRMKRRLRLGLPIYPPDLSGQQPMEPVIMNLAPTASPVFPLIGLMPQAPLTSYPISDSLFPNLCMRSSAFQQPQFENRGYSRVCNSHENFLASPAYYNSNQASSSCSLASLGSLSPSEPARALKVDLPSFQTQHGPWPFPSIEADGVASVRNSELLDAVVKGRTPCGHSLTTAKAKTGDWSLCGSSPQEAEWDAYCPLISSSSSLLSGGTANSSELEYADLNPGEASGLMITEQSCSDLETIYDSIFFEPEHLP